MSIFHFKIKLKGSKPAITREVLVESEKTFEHLHQVIQAVMPWDNDHSYGFEYKNKSLFVCDKGFMLDEDERLVSKVKLSDYFKQVKDTITYVYDYGDNWEHNITLHKILEKDSKIKYPFCLEGKNAAPFEDCGGIWGFYDILEIIKNPKHPEYKDTRKWIGLAKNETFDPEFFDIEEANRCLSKIK